jgi:hypothetical protein
MTSRREFLQSAAVVVAPLGAANFAIAGGAVSPQAVAAGALHAVLIEDRFAAARGFGARLAARGATVHAIADGDVTAVWLGELSPAWSRGRVTVAGLTRAPALFVLEQLAWSHGLRVVYHAEHVVHGEHGTEHAVLRGAAAGREASHFAHRGPLWPSLAADAVADHIANPQRGAVGYSGAGLQPVLPEGSVLLTSWVIAAV